MAFTRWDREERRLIKICSSETIQLEGYQPLPPAEHVSESIKAQPAEAKCPSCDQYTFYDPDNPMCQRCGFHDG